MKKLLNISVIAALAVLPLAANAAVTDAVPGPTVTGDTATAATATTAPKYGLAAAESNDGNVATAGYVKGAYNAAIKAINKVSETAGNAANQDLTNLSATGKANVSAQGTVDTSGSTNYGTGTVGAAINAIKTTADDAVQNVKVNGTALSEDANGDVNVTIVEGATNGTVAVNGTDVAVHGLGSAAYSATTDYISSTAGSVKTANIDNGQVTKEKLAQAVQDSLDAADSALQAGDNISELVNDAGYLTSTDLGDYATHDGVETTVTNALNGVSVTYDLSGLGVSTGAVTGSANAAITVMDTWGSNTAAAQTISAPVDLTSTVAVTGLTGNSSGQTATVTHGTVTYAEPANP